MPIARQFPVPCIREVETGWALQLNRACSIPFKSREEGIEYADTRSVAQSKGKLYAQVPGTLRFELIDEEKPELELDA